MKSNSYRSILLAAAHTDLLLLLLLLLRLLLLLKLILLLFVTAAVGDNVDLVADIAAAAAAVALAVAVAVVAVCPCSCSVLASGDADAKDLLQSSLQQASTSSYLATYMQYLAYNIASVVIHEFIGIINRIDVFRSLCL